MIRKTLAILGLAAVAIAGSAQAAEQQVCGPRALLVSKLNAEFKERPQAAGLAHTGKVIEIFASAAGTWTAIVTTPQGISCLVAAGEAWKAQGVGRDPESATHDMNWSGK
jgi:hypothetical protein